MKYFFIFTTFFSLCARAQISPTLTVPRGHRGDVRNCYFTPDDRYIVSADEDHVLSIWDGDDGRQIFILRDSSASFRKIEMNATGSLISALTDSGKLYVIDFRQLKVKTVFNRVSDFSMYSADGTIYFATSPSAIKKYDPLSGSAKQVRYDKPSRMVSLRKLIAVSSTAIAVEDADGRLWLIDTRLPKSLPLASVINGRLRLFDYQSSSGLLLCSNVRSMRGVDYYGMPLTVIDLLGVDARTGAVKKKISLGKGIQNYDCLFISEKNKFLFSSDFSTEDGYYILREPSIYSLETGKLEGSLNGDFEISLGSLNLNYSKKNLVVRSGLMFTTDIYRRWDFAKNSSAVCAQFEPGQLDLRIACANNSRKIAVFNKDLLLPVIYPDGSIDKKESGWIKKYNDLKIDFPGRGVKFPDQLPGTGFRSLFSDQVAINDSVFLYQSPEPDTGTWQYTGIVYRRRNNTTDSFEFRYGLIAKPFMDDHSLFWTKENRLYSWDLATFQMTDSIQLPQQEPLERLFPAGEDLLLDRGYHGGFGHVAYKYNIRTKTISDTAFPIQTQFQRPYFEKNYAHTLEGEFHSDLTAKDYDYLNGILCRYLALPGRVDTVAVLDSSGETVSYKAVQQQGMLEFSSLDTGNKKLTEVLERIGNLPVQQVRYWADGRYIILSREDKLFVYSFNNDSLERKIDCPAGYYSKLFILDNKQVLVSDKDHNDTYIIDATAGGILKHLTGFFNPEIRQPDHLLLLQDAAFGNFYVYNNSTYQYISSVTLFSKTDYVVNTRQGLFDGTDEAIENLYFLINDTADAKKPWKTIDLKQLKAKYYIPGLWNKLITGDSTDLPDVESIKSLSLAPAIEPDSAWSFTKPFKITLTDQGGGIGPVRIVINGKEIIADARSDKNPAAKEMTLLIDLRRYEKYFYQYNNSIQVFSSNADSSLSARGVIVASKKEGAKEANPRLFVVSIGTSDYKGSEIDLQYSSKDASAMALALKAGAYKLFSADSTEIYALTSDAKDSSLLPSKINIERVFREVEKKARAKDIVVLYISGHGINSGNEFYYLTRDAFTANPSAYSFKEVLQAVAVSSNEFTAYLNRIAAQKQLFIIDACASGKLVENLIAHRDIPYSTLKALDRLRDRTGMHIITGCAADAVSYEASRFGQGLLTYSLLEGMKGASLRENKFLDVAQWFQYARSRVPELAEGLGGIQTPQVYNPRSNESFDVAELDDEEKLLIPLARQKPVFIKSLFQEEEKFADILSLGRVLDASLFESSSKGTGSNFVFFPVDGFSDAYQVLGRYKTGENQISATIKVIQTAKQNTVLSFSLSAPDAKILSSAILEKLKELK